MSIEHLDKNRLINLEYSLFKEILRTNRAGAYSSSSIIGCNTRKYHGLLVAPVENLDNERHVLLSSLDVSVIQHNQSFNLGIHKYGGSHFEPKGHKYVRDYEMYPIPTTTYRVGGVVLTQELILVEQTSQVLLRFTLQEAKSETKLRLKPFLAFRHIHDLTHENLAANTRYGLVDGGISLCLYQGFPSLFMQLSGAVDFVANPDWYRGVEYLKEEERGYNYKEDLYVPGYFELDIKKGESIVFAAGTNIALVKGLKKKFTSEAKKRLPRTGLLNNLLNAAQQFIICNGKECRLMAGYHWYGPRLRDTLVALPGLTVYQQDKSSFEAILQNAVSELKNDFLEAKYFVVKDIDAPLWLFWTLQKCVDYCGVQELWLRFGDVLKDILNFYKNLRTEQFYLNKEGLIFAKVDNVPLTWMDAVVGNKPVTPRYGMPVEINALWYNAICFTLDLARSNGDSDFIDEWEALSISLGNAFVKTYWNEGLGYLNDCVIDECKDSDIRPNQIIATAMPFSPLSMDQKKSVADVVKKELLTAKGIRSLSPKDPKYKGVMEGNVWQRDLALHQGTVFPWLFAFFIDTYLVVHKKGGLPFVQRLLEEYEKELGEHCLGTISEAYNGNPPHTAKGAVSMAWNVAGILRVLKEVETYE